jgi:hypothetical protein
LLAAPSDFFIFLSSDLQMSSAVQLANPKAEVARRGQALNHNITAALGLQEVLKTNLGPKGTIKMYFILI